jgi:hypothetical protein
VVQDVSARFAVDSGAMRDNERAPGRTARGAGKIFNVSVSGRGPTLREH